MWKKEEFDETAGGVEGLFAASWLLLALFAIAGNLTGILYSPKKRKLSERKEYKKMHYYS
jgi:hypothetical protein